MVVLVIGLCAVSLSFHFVVEGLGGIQDHLIGGQPHALFHSHEGDQFVVSESENGDPAQTWIWFPFISKLKTISRPLAPLLHPP